MNLLFIGTAFPPRANTARVTHLAKYLSQNNQIEALTYSEKYLTTFIGSDYSLYNKIRDRVHYNFIEPGIIRKRFVRNTKSDNIEPKRTKAKESILLQLLIPDPHIDALLKFYSAAKKIITINKIDIIITFTYPYTMLLVGYLLKRKFPNLTWAADYGDPWKDCPATELNLSKLRKTIDYKIETHILKMTDTVFVTTEATKKLYIKNFPFLKGKLKIFTMGFDPDDFLNIIKIKKKDSKKITLIHTGRIYHEARNPFPFLEACEELLQKNPSINKRIEIYFIGELDKKILDYINDSNLNILIKYIPWVTMDESIQWMQSSDYLLLFGNYGAIQIPGKLFQYIGSQKPILLFYETDNDPVIPILSSIPKCETTKNDKNNITKILTDILSNNSSMEYENQKYDTSKFSWNKISKDMSIHLQDLLRSKQTS